MKHLRVTICILLLLLLATPIVALASDISGAKWYGLITVSNSDTAATNVATTANISTANLIAGNFLNSEADNCVVRSSSGADIEFMPGYTDVNPWAFWVPSIGANSYLTYILYTANSTGGDLFYFPGAGGMTTTDNASLELGDNFTVEQKGWWNTTAGGNKHSVSKMGAFETFVDPDTSGDITSRIGGGLDFVRANSDWVSIPDSNGFSFTDGLGQDEPFSIVAWVNMDDATDGRIVSKWTAAKIEWSLFTSNTDVLGIILADPTAAVYIQRTTAAITSYEGDWMHIVATYDGSEVLAGLDVYINGEVADTTDGTVGPYVGMTNNNAVVELGSRLAGTGQFFDGIMSEVKIYTAELTPAEVLADYTGSHKATDLEAWYRLDEGAGNPTDSSGNGHDATANTADWIPAISVTASGISSGEYSVKTTTKPVLDFVPGNLDYVSVDDHDDFSFTDGNDLPFTIIAWVNLDDATDRSFVTKLDNAPLAWEWRFFTGATDNLTFYATSPSSADTMGRTTGVITGYEGSYTHFAGTYDGTELVGGFNIYINSVDSDISNTTSGAYIGMTNTDAEVNIGARDDGSSLYIDGRIAEVKIYARELSPAEIASDFGGQHSSTDLVGWWMLDEGTGDSLADNSGNLHTATNHGADWVVADPLAIYIDDDLMDLTDMTAVPDNNSVWRFAANDSMMYLESQEIIIDSVQAQYIEWEYDAVFYDQSANDNDATPTFRSASSDADVSANMTAFLPVAEAQAPGYVLGVGVPFIDADALTGNVTAPFTVVPPTGGFPLAGVIAAVAAATDTPAQLPLLLIAVFIILAASLSMSAIIRKSGSGSLIVKIIVITAFMGVFIALRNFGIDLWMLVVFLIIAVAMGMASRHQAWQ